MSIKLQPNRRRGTSGFSLMELLIVIAIILTILSVTIPHVHKIKMGANETVVTKQIGTIHTAQAQYHAQFGKFAVSLSELGEPPSGADLIPRELAGGKKNGYTLQLQGTATGYTITANPDSYDGTGRRTFYSDQNMVIRHHWGPEPATPASPAI
jgi:type IV pilus assembly protein PilA